MYEQTLKVKLEYEEVITALHLNKDTRDTLQVLLTTTSPAKIRQKQAQKIMES